MSWEAWGDPPDGPELPEGWWDEDQVSAMRDAVMALCNEMLYEGREKNNGVAVKFLARMQILKLRAGLVNADDPIVAEALAMFGESP